ncbi:MAG: alkaline phosphatase family protein [Rhodospirillales bacterium]|nr:alkaline phosphatase family protein [Rhodospirillales bacterium]
MAIIIGPILGWRGEQDGASLVSVMIVRNDDAAPGTVTWSTGAEGAGGTGALVKLSDFASSTVYAAEVSVPPTQERQSVEYSISGDDRRWRFTVPGRGDRPRIAYGSCNGFSLPGDMRRIADKNALWRDLIGEHAREPFHLLMMGGDQIYADQLWDLVPELRRFNELPRDDRIRKKASASLRTNLERFFLTTYTDRFGPDAAAEAFASIPTLMMWDDHDIFDGWGSYSPEEQNSPVFQAIFAVARKAFALFQLMTSPDGGTWPRLPGEAFNALLHCGGCAILVLDLRSERTQSQILSPASWEAVFAAVDAAHGLRHLLVMSSIPVLHPDMSFIERTLGLLPGNQGGIEDDLNDQWVSYNHKTERLRLIHRLFDFAAANGTRVTIVSGDVHVAANGVIESTRRPVRDTNAEVITQLTSSAIVHPPPPRVVRFFLEQIGSQVQEIDRDITGRMLQFPATTYRFVAERNWMTIEVDDVDRIWINWRIEGAPQPLTKVIHPCAEVAPGAVTPATTA